MDKVNEWGFLVSRTFYNHRHSVSGSAQRVADVVKGTRRYVPPVLLCSGYAVDISYDTFCVMRHVDYERPGGRASSQGLTVFVRSSFTREELNRINEYIYYRLPDVLFLVGFTWYTRFSVKPIEAYYSSAAAKKLIVVSSLWESFCDSSTCAAGRGVG